MFQNETKGQSGSWIILFNFLCNMELLSEVAFCKCLSK